MMIDCIDHRCSTKDASLGFTRREFLSYLLGTAEMLHIDIHSETSLSYNLKRRRYSDHLKRPLMSSLPRVNHPASPLERVLAAITPYMLLHIPPRVSHPSVPSCPFLLHFAVGENEYFNGILTMLLIAR